MNGTNYVGELGRAHLSEFEIFYPTKLLVICCTLLDGLLEFFFFEFFKNCAIMFPTFVGPWFIFCEFLNMHRQVHTISSYTPSKIHKKKK